MTIPRQARDRGQGGLSCSDLVGGSSRLREANFDAGQALINADWCGDRGAIGRSTDRIGTYFRAWFAHKPVYDPLASCKIMLLVIDPADPPAS
jgi:hypothetical protein